jgi:hypothetical protein
MIKLIFLIRRKPGLTPEQFMRHYEDTHADLALTYIRPFLLDYRRSYPQTGSSFLSAVTQEDDVAEQTETQYDSITEMWLADRAAVDEMFKVLSEPEARRVLGEDEERFIDLPTVQMLECIEGRSAF